jgi:glycosyltransferase involved in cell wall biosynthesis
MKLLIVSSYPPRKCGIATFTQDLVANLRQQEPSVEIGIVALGDGTVGYDGDVVHIIEHHDAESYQKAAAWINASGYEVLVIEHEYGLYGANDGEAVLTLAKESRLPIITTLHTVLAHPSKQQRDILASLCRSSAAVVTMASNSRHMLAKVYGVPKTKVHVIHHGVPSHEGYPSRTVLKQRYGMKGKTVVSTFGLLSEGKGIEYGIMAMASVVKEHPEALYIIAGQTHPVVREKEGEQYRRKLEQMVADKGLKNNVRFIDRYFSQEDLVRLLLLSDIYMTPYLGREQAVSGTLAYAAGCGKAIVSTSYPYAQELLADGRGILADFADPDSLARALLQLLDHQQQRLDMEQKMAEFGKNMTWGTVARRYKEVFAHVLAMEKLLSVCPSDRCLFRMSDDTGMFQHGILTVPNLHEGYTTDDNVRALLLAALRYKGKKDERILVLVQKYLAFVAYAYKDGWFRNFMGYDRKFLGECGSQDCFGRCLWVLGTLSIASWLPGSVTEVCNTLFQQAFSSISKVTAIRAKAYSIIGLAHRNVKAESPILVALAQDLVAAYTRTYSDSWRWFEDEVTYCNAILPLALFEAYRTTGMKKFLAVATDSCDFLIKLTVRDGFFSPVGCKGWCHRGSEPALYDQQPVEAVGMVQLCLTAYDVTRQVRYHELAKTCLLWFAGKNLLGLPLADGNEGGCFDGLEAHGVNQNQGAESILSWQLAWFLWHGERK